MTKEFAETYPYSEAQVTDMLIRDYSAKSVANYLEMLKKKLKDNSLF